MVQGSRNALKDADEQMRVELLTRADNPYIGVEQLQAALDAEQGLSDALADDSLS